MKLHHFWIASTIFYYWARNNLANRINEELEYRGYFLKKREFNKWLDPRLIDKIKAWIFPVNIVRIFKKGKYYSENQEAVLKEVKQEGLIDKIEERDLEEELKINKLTIDVYNMSVRIKKGKHLSICSDAPYNYFPFDDEIILTEPKEAKKEEFFNNGKEHHLSITLPTSIPYYIEARIEKGNIEIKGANLDSVKLKTQNGVIEIYDSIPAKSVIKKQGILNREIYQLDQNGKTAKCKLNNQIESFSIENEFFNFETEKGKNSFQYKKR